MSIATKSTTLWSLATVKSWLKVTENDHDQLIINLADAATEFIERDTRRYFVTRTVTEERNGDGSRILFLYHYPVLSLTSITMLRWPTDATTEVMDVTDYVFNATTGKVWSHSDYFNRGVGNITIVYSTGYGAQDANTLPSDIMVAGLELVKLLFLEQTTGIIGVQSINIGSNSFMLRPEWPKQIKDTIERWRRPF